MAPARLTLALIVAAALAGCGGSGGSSTGSTTSQGSTTQAAQQAASTSCPDRLTTSETCWFAGVTASEHAKRLAGGFVVAGEPMKCIGTKAEWICESTRRKAWVRRS